MFVDFPDCSIHTQLIGHGCTLPPQTKNTFCQLKDTGQFFVVLIFFRRCRTLNPPIRRSPTRTQNYSAPRCRHRQFCRQCEDSPLLWSDMHAGEGPGQVSGQPWPGRETIAEPDVRLSETRAGARRFRASTGDLLERPSSRAIHCEPAAFSLT